MPSTTYTGTRSPILQGGFNDGYVPTPNLNPRAPDIKSVPSLPSGVRAVSPQEIIERFGSPSMDARPSLEGVVESSVSLLKPDEFIQRYSGRVYPMGITYDQEGHGDVVFKPREVLTEDNLERKLRTVPEHAKENVRKSFSFGKRMQEKFISYVDSVEGKDFKDYLEKNIYRGTVKDDFGIDAIRAGQYGDEMVAAITVGGKRYLFFNRDLFSQYYNDLHQRNSDITADHAFVRVLKHEAIHPHTPWQYLAAGKYQAELYDEKELLKIELRGMHETKSEVERGIGYTFAMVNVERYIMNLSLEHGEKFHRPMTDVYVWAKLGDLTDELEEEGFDPDEIAEIIGAAYDDIIARGRVSPDVGSRRTSRDQEE